MKKKEVLAVSICLMAPFFSALLNTGCNGNSPTSSSSSTSNPTATLTPVVNAQGTPCTFYGSYGQTGIALTPLPQNQYVAIDIPVPTKSPCEYPSFGGANGSAGIYAANSGSVPETIELAAYGRSSSSTGPPYGSSVSVSIPVTTGGWELVSMPLISFTDCGGDIYLAAHALGPDLSIGAEGPNNHQTTSGSTAGSMRGYLPTPTATSSTGPNYEMFIKSCP